MQLELMPSRVLRHMRTPTISAHDVPRHTRACSQPGPRRGRRPRCSDQLHHPYCFLACGAQTSLVGHGRPERWLGRSMLQEGHSQFEAGGHLLHSLPTQTGKVHTAVILHRRHARALHSWGGSLVPWIRLRWPAPPMSAKASPQRSRYPSVASVYLPPVGRTAYFGLDDRWELALCLLREGLAQAQAEDSELLAGGDWIVANYLEALGHNVSGQEEGAGGDDDAHEGTTLRRIHQDFNRTEDLIMLMSTLAMEPCTPVNGFRYTFVPWNIRQRPKSLTCSCERVFTTRVETDTNAALATGHVPLRCELTLRRQPGDASSSADHEGLTGDLHRYSKQARRRATRRRWPDRRELNPGQLAALISESAWRSPQLLQNSIRGAARAAVPKGRLRRPTPFDEMTATIEHDRRVTKHRNARKSSPSGCIRRDSGSAAGATKKNSST